MKLIFLFALIQISICFSDVGYCQYFPDDLGNRWIYEEIEDDHFTTPKLKYRTVSITDTGIVVDFHRYTKSSLSTLQRWDANGNLFVIDPNGDERLYIPSKADSGAIVFYPFNSNGEYYTFQLVDVATEERFGIIDTTEYWWVTISQFLNWEEIGVSRLFGLVYHHNLESDIYWYLKGCILRDKVFGDTTTYVSVREKLSYSEPIILMQNHPNPFNPETKIPIISNQHGKVNLEIYDMSGKLIQEFVFDSVQKGLHEFSFRPSPGIASGIYLVILRTGNIIQTKKIIFQK